MYAYNNIPTLHIILCIGVNYIAVSVDLAIAVILEHVRLNGNVLIIYNTILSTHTHTCSFSYTMHIILINNMYVFDRNKLCRYVYGPDYNENIKNILNETRWQRLKRNVRYVNIKYSKAVGMEKNTLAHFKKKICHDITSVIGRRTITTRTTMTGNEKNDQ